MRADDILARSIRDCLLTIILVDRRFFEVVPAAARHALYHEDLGVYAVPIDRLPPRVEAMVRRVCWERDAAGAKSRAARVVRVELDDDLARFVEGFARARGISVEAAIPLLIRIARRALRIEQHAPLLPS